MLALFLLLYIPLFSFVADAPLSLLFQHTVLPFSDCVLPLSHFLLLFVHSRIHALSSFLFPNWFLFLSSFFSLLTSFFKFYCLLVFFHPFYLLARFFPFIFMFCNLLPLFPISSLSLSLPPVPSSSYPCSHTLCSLFLISDIPYLTFFLITSDFTRSFLIHSLASPPLLSSCRSFRQT
jgi:hypothetical protein